MTPTDQQGQEHSKMSPSHCPGTNHQASGSTSTQISNATSANFFAMPGSPQGPRPRLPIRDSTPLMPNA